MTLFAVLGVLAVTIALILWGRWVWRKHEREALYEPGPETRSHTRDAGFLSNFFHDGGMGGGGGI